MAEHLLLTKETNSQSRFFTLCASRELLDIGNRAERTHPIVKVPLRKGDIRLLNNLEMKVKRCSIDEQVVDIIIEPLFLWVPDCRKLSLAQVEQESGILHIGPDGEIVLKVVDLDGRAHFRMALARDVWVTSPEKALE